MGAVPVALAVPAILGPAATEAHTYEAVLSSGWHCNHLRLTTSEGSDLLAAIVKCGEQTIYIPRQAFIYQSPGDTELHAYIALPKHWEDDSIDVSMVWCEDGIIEFINRLSKRNAD